MKRFAAHYALVADGQIVDNPLITTDDEGLVVSIERFDPSTLDGMESVEFHSGVLLPTLVNAHSHVELAYLKGAIPRGCGFAGFAGAMAAVRDNFSDEERREATAKADREMFEAGVGAVGDISNDDSSFGIKARSPLHYHTFGEVFGLKVNNFERIRSYSGSGFFANAQNDRENGAQDNRGGVFSITPHSLYSLNDELLKRICREGEGVLSIHFMESEAERELFEGRGSLFEWFAHQGFKPDFLGYGSPAERLAACVPADRSVMLVHCTCVTQRDIDVIMNHFRAPVYWCLCPRSNDYISGLQPDVELLCRNGLKICIGTDSLASNTSLSPFEELKMIKNRDADEVLRWVTVNGAEALGVRGGAGRLEVGSRCGLTAVEGLDFAEGMRITEKSTISRLV